VIVAEGLGKAFGALQAVEGVSFTVGAGEIFGLLGPNGAGKTTTVRMLAGLIGPSSGRATVDGHDVVADATTVRAMTGVLTESPGLHSRLTARQNLAYYGRLYGMVGANLEGAVDRYLDLVGLTDAADRKAGTFSKGMRQKVAIARALLHEPKVIYLDEPTSTLDPTAAKGIRDFVATLRDAGRSIVICTHNLDEAERLCDRIAIVSRTILASGTPAELRRSAGLRPTTVHLDGGVGAHALSELAATLPFVAATRITAEGLAVTLANGEADAPDLIRTLVERGARITAVGTDSVSLEDVYLGLVGPVGASVPEATDAD
jgi:ABC-2 type transport system ATP-binding protein